VEFHKGNSIFSYPHEKKWTSGNPPRQPSPDGSHALSGQGHRLAHVETTTRHHTKQTDEHGGAYIQKLAHLNSPFVNPGNPIVSVLEPGSVLMVRRYNLVFHKGNSIFSYPHEKNEEPTF
jgi:hypothetical protein